jgi:CysZ protein
MADVMLALMRTLASLREGRIWTYLVAPALVSFVLWIGLAYWGLRELVEWLIGFPPMSLLVGWGAVWLAHMLAWIGGWLAIFACAYLTASLLAALFVLPLFLKHLANGQYRDVAAMGKDSFVAATVNSLAATVLFILAWLLTVPLWLIPGMALILPLVLMGWYNRRTFAYDALSMHATDQEWRALRLRHKRPLFMLGLTMALLAHVPLVGLLVPALAALAFTHFGLEALRRDRGGAVVTIEGEKS